VTVETAAVMAEVTAEAPVVETAAAVAVAATDPATPADRV
jgi:hypothetical protein